jgi:hypothetical protein
MKVTLEDRQKFYFNYFRKIDFTKYDVNCFCRIENESYREISFPIKDFNDILNITFSVISKYSKYITIDFDKDDIEISIHKLKSCHEPTFIISKCFWARDIIRKDDLFQVLYSIDSDIDNLLHLKAIKSKEYITECYSYSFGFGRPCIVGTELISIGGSSNYWGEKKDLN